jgi:hypothetical protein
MGARTWNVVPVKTPEGWRRIKPVTSKSGRHGFEHFLTTDDCIVLTFDISNSGKRSITVKAAGEGLKKAEAVTKLLKSWEDGIEVSTKELEALLNS